MEILDNLNKYIPNAKRETGEEGRGGEREREMEIRAWDFIDDVDRIAILRRLPCINFCHAIKRLGRISCRGIIRTG